MSVVASAVSKKQRLAVMKKARRKRKRQALAQARAGDGEHHVPEEEDGEDICEDEKSGQERQRYHEEWLERERLAQEAFRLRSEREEAARKRQEDEERSIKEEWELQQKKEEQEKEHKQQEKKNREEAVQKMLDQAESQLSNSGPWMNPEAPNSGNSGNSENYGTERDVQNCPFFLKTGACRFGDRCSRKHVYPASSSTLMIRGMFVTFGMDQCHRDDYDTDASLEHSEEELYENFVEFYHDVLPEFQGLGKVVQFKVSCNFEPHLRGNVYVQFDTEDQCIEAYQKFNGRWYAGKQLHCELCPVTRWKNAICGLFNKLKCPKGKHCNFLHVFRNPANEFWEADRDMSPDRARDGSWRGGWHSERGGDWSWRHRHGSRSPPRSERSGAARRGSERRGSRRSHSRERASSHRRGESLRSDSQSSRWRPAGSSSRRERCRSRSRSHGGDRETDRLRNRSRDRERDGHTSRERDRSPDKSQNGDTRRKRRSRSGSEDGAMTRRSKRERSDRGGLEKLKREDGEGRGGGSDDGNTAHRRRKHSKKSKKKSKKKKKKKSRSVEAISSSGESEDQDDPDVEIKEEASPLHSTDGVQEVSSVELSSHPCVDSQNTAELKSVVEETTESTDPELPRQQEENNVTTV